MPGPAIAIDLWVSEPVARAIVNLGWARSARRAQFERHRICGDEDAIRLNFLPADLQDLSAAEADVFDAGILKDLGAAGNGGSGQLADHLARVDRAAGDFLRNTEFAGPSVQAIGDFGLERGVVNFPDAGERQVAVEIQVLHDSGDARQYVAQTGHVASGGLGQG